MLDTFAEIQPVDSITISHRSVSHSGGTKRQNVIFGKPIPRIEEAMLLAALAGRRARSELESAAQLPPYIPMVLLRAF